MGGEKRNPFLVPSTRERRKKETTEPAYRSSHLKEKPHVDPRGTPSVAAEEVAR